ncbi:MAG: hypothetical protein AB7E42_00010 [Anaerotignaceae bacterium]
MTKGEAKKLALRWLDEATLNGQEAGAELTADYKDKFNYFLYNVLVYVAAVFKISRTFSVTITEGTAKGSYVSFTLPNDVMELDKIIRYNASQYEEVRAFRKDGDHVYLIPKNALGENDTLEFIYWGMPGVVAVDADDTATIEVVSKAEQLVPLRLAIEATAGSDETSGISAYLEGKYSNMVANLLGEEKGAVSGMVERLYAQ